MATADFEARQLLKAYRKGLISDDLFEEQMQELGKDSSSEGYMYNGTCHTTEKEMVMALLDEFRCGENFAAEYLNRWVEVSDQECVKGGLRVVQQRESYHASILEARLSELGGDPQCTVPSERRDKELPYFADANKTDLEKLQSIAAQLSDPAAALKPLTDAIAQIQDDQHSKELLSSLVDDEMSSVKWLLNTCETLSK
jgi:hypothetical protein